jgi:PAS domain S-box-containing protein
MQRLALVAQATGDVIRDWDVERGTICLSEELTGWGHILDHADAVAASWWDAHIHPDDAARVRTSLERAFRSNDPRWSAEYRFRRGDGTYGFVLERALLIRLEDGTVSRLVAAVEDITSRVDAEQVRATMAHDFNNVLMGIQPFAEVVRRRTTDPRITHAASQILKSVARGRRIALDLPHPRHDAPQAPALERILLVEDDEIFAEGLVQLLRLEGLHVDLVTHGALAVEAVERLAPQAVILDLGLPDAHGTEVYERLAARWPDLPVIFNSGHEGTQRLTRYLERPNVRFLHKPYDVDALMRMLREIA